MAASEDAALQGPAHSQSGSAINDNQKQSTISSHQSAISLSPTDGVLVVDKPSGPTSHDVVARVRRALGIRRVGHAGTLDPLATGVLPLVVGRATRLASLLSGGDKEYLAGIRLGLATATYDAADRSLSVVPIPPGISTAEVANALDSFRGTFDQIPPPFSAKKIDGVRAYKLARKGKPITPAAARVTVHDLAVEEYTDGLVTVRVRASAGFYVRSLAHDLGQQLGCGAHLETLRRVRAGSFTDVDSIPLGDVEKDPMAAASRMLPLDALLPDIPAVVLGDRDRERACHGSDVELHEVVEAFGGGDATRRRLVDASGRLLAVAEVRTGGLLHPVIVLG